MSSPYSPYHTRIQPFPPPSSFYFIIEPFFDIAISTFFTFFSWPVLIPFNKFRSLNRSRPRVAPFRTLCPFPTTLPQTFIHPNPPSSTSPSPTLHFQTLPTSLPIPTPLTLLYKSKGRNQIPDRDYQQSTPKPHRKILRVFDISILCA